MELKSKKILFSAVPTFARTLKWPLPLPNFRKYKAAFQVSFHLPSRGLVSTLEQSHMPFQNKPGLPPPFLTTVSGRQQNWGSAPGPVLWEQQCIKAKLKTRHYIIAFYYLKLPFPCHTYMWERVYTHREPRAFQAAHIRHSPVSFSLSLNFN